MSAFWSTDMAGRPISYPASRQEYTKRSARRVHFQGEDLNTATSFFEVSLMRRGAITRVLVRNGHDRPAGSLRHPIRDVVQRLAL